MDNITKEIKQKLLYDIEDLISYGRDESIINPDLLEYLEINDLEGIKKNLLQKVNILSQEDKDWLDQFKKH